MQKAEILKKKIGPNRVKKIYFLVLLPSFVIIFSTITNPIIWSVDEKVLALTL